MGSNVQFTHLTVLLADFLIIFATLLVLLLILFRSKMIKLTELLVLNKFATNLVSKLVYKSQIPLPLSSTVSF